MRRIAYITFIFLSICFSKGNAQEQFTVGAGLGPNFFFGSVSRVDRVGFSTYLDTKYKFKDIYAVGLSHSYSSLHASRYGDSDGAYRIINNFETKANAFDLHLQVDLIEAFNKDNDKSKFKAYFDFGAGFVLFNEMAYIYSPQVGELIPDYIHKQSHGKDQLVKLQFGGEICYELNNEFDIFSSFMGHQCLNSKIDGYETYYDGTPADNDFYYTLSFGGRYNLTPPENRRKQRAKKKKTKVLVDQTYRFERFTNKKPSTHYKKKQSSVLDIDRFTGRKKQKTSWFKNLFKKNR